MIEILSHNAPMLSLRIVHEGREIQVDVSPVRRVDALLTDSLENCLTRYGIGEGLESWAVLNKLTIVAFHETKLQGISLRDLFWALGYALEDLRAEIRRFEGSKKRTAQPIGQDPKDGRAQLYRLSEILEDYEKFTPITDEERREVFATLKHEMRGPK